MEPSAKKAKKGEEHPQPSHENENFDKEIEEQVGKLDPLQMKLDVLSDEAAAEVVGIELKYSKLKRPFYNQRNEIIKKIPDFWGRVLRSHETMGELLQDFDYSILQCLDSLDVIEETKSDFKIVFNFKPNEFFQNSSLEKSLVFADDDIKSTATPIKWKNPKTPDENDDSFFVRWFSNGAADDDELNSIAGLIKEDLWPNPVVCFTQALEAEADEEEEDGDGGDDDGGDGDDGDDGDDGEDGDDGDDGADGADGDEDEEEDDE